MTIAVGSNEAVQESLAQLEYQCPGWVIVWRGCGGKQYVPAPCCDPCCIPCQQIRARRLRAGWFPVLQGMEHPKRLTLTIRSGFDLAERIEVEARAFRRLLDTRLGPRNWARFQDEAAEFWTHHLGQTESDEFVIEERLKAGLASLDRFGRDLLLYHAENGGWPRVRDLIGPGFSSREVTWSNEHGWHPHRHVIYDGEYVPMPLLVVLWRNALGADYNPVLYVESLGTSYKAMSEAIKYVAKAWDIPERKRPELREALKGKKKIWPLGGARPVPVEKTCPVCGAADCGVDGVCMGQTMWRGKDGQGKELAVVLVFDPGGDPGEYVALRREKGGWREVPLHLINMSFACHSSPARAGPGPPGDPGRGIPQSLRLGDR